MKSNLINILIGVAIVGALVAAYFFFIKKGPTLEPLTSATGVASGQNTDSTIIDPSIGQDFIELLLSVKSIKLDDSIFSDPAFLSLRDSSILILLVDNGAIGRPNPFAPIGSDVSGIQNSDSNININTGDDLTPAGNLDGSLPEGSEPKNSTNETGA